MGVGVRDGRDGGGGGAGAGDGAAELPLVRGAVLAPLGDARALVVVPGDAPGDEGDPADPGGAGLLVDAAQQPGEVGGVEERLALVDAGAGVGRPDVGLVPHLPGVDAPPEVARQDDGRAPGEAAQVLVVAVAAQVLGVVGRPVRLSPGPAVVGEQAQHPQAPAADVVHHAVVLLQGGAPVGAGRRPVRVAAPEAEVDPHPPGPRLLDQGGLGEQAVGEGDLPRVVEGPAPVQAPGAPGARERVRERQRPWTLPPWRRGPGWRWASRWGCG